MIISRAPVLRRSLHLVLGLSEHLAKKSKESFTQQKLIQAFQPNRSQAGTHACLFDLSPVNCRGEVLFSWSCHHVVDELVTMKGPQCSRKTIRGVQHFALLRAI